MEEGHLIMDKEIVHPKEKFRKTVNKGKDKSAMIPTSSFSELTIYDRAIQGPTASNTATKRASSSSEEGINVSNESIEKNLEFLRKSFNDSHVDFSDDDCEKARSYHDGKRVDTRDKRGTEVAWTDDEPQSTTLNCQQQLRRNAEMTAEEKADHVVREADQARE